MRELKIYFNSQKPNMSHKFVSGTNHPKSKLNANKKMRTFPVKNFNLKALPCSKYVNVVFFTFLFVIVCVGFVKRISIERCC